MTRFPSTSGFRMTPAFGVLVISLLGGCEAGGQRDAGTGATASTATLVNPGNWPTCGVELRARIGTISGDPHLEFGLIEDVRILSDSVIAAVDRQTKDVRLFDATGRFLTMVGREGDGPGEFREPIAVGPWGHDDFIVWDWRRQTMSIFSMSGAFVDSFRLRPPTINPTGDLEVLAAEERLIVGDEGGVPRTPIGEVREVPLRLLAYDFTGMLRDTLLTSSYGYQVHWSERSAATPLFSSVGAYASDGTRLYVTSGHDARVDIFDPSGLLTDSLTWTAAPEATTDASVEAHLEERSKLQRTQFGLGRGSADHGPRSRFFPMSGDLMVGAGGDVWVQKYRRPRDLYQTWWRFAPGGDFLCATNLPEMVKATDASDDMLVGMYQDDFGAYYVDVYAVQPPHS